jgi:hypothetical protein
VKHRVYLYERGGRRRLEEITGITQVQWGRRRDDISEASVKIAFQHYVDNAEKYNQIVPGRHELVIWREDQRSWEGPITRVALNGTGVEVFARDVMHYATGTPLVDAYSSAHPNVETVVGRAGRILAAELGREWDNAAIVDPPINVVDHIVEHHYPNEARTTAVTTAYEADVFTHIDSLAQKSGMDYAVIGRAIHLWDTSRPLSTTQTITEADFLGQITLTLYGMELATRAVSTDGKGLVGIAGGVDPYYGAWTRLNNAYDEDASESPTLAELRSQAQRNLAGRNPVPMMVRIPDGSSLNPRGSIKIEQLVPGVFFPLLATILGRTVSQMQKLNEMSVTETEGGEAITATFVSASSPDEDEEEDE